MASKSNNTPAKPSRKQDKTPGSGRTGRASPARSTKTRPDGDNAAAAEGGEPRRPQRGHRLAAALGARSTGRIAEEEGSQYPVREDQRRTPLPDRPGVTERDVEREVEALNDLDLEGLRAAWRSRFGPPPALRSVELLRLRWPGACRRQSMAVSMPISAASSETGGVSRQKG